jgi:hypothetical protein
LIGIGGGIVIVPVVFYGLVETGTSADQAAHVAVGTSLAAILPAALLSSLAHWRAGNTDFRFLRDWGPGIATGVVVAQLAAPHVRGSMMTGLFALRRRFHRHLPSETAAAGDHCAAALGLRAGLSVPRLAARHAPASDRHRPIQIRRIQAERVYKVARNLDYWKPGRKPRVRATRSRGSAPDLAGAIEHAPSTRET